MLYHPFDFFLRFWNRPESSGLVKMSAICSFVLTYLTSINLFGPDKNCRNQWYFRLICFVLGENFLPSAIVMQLVLSSNTLQHIVEVFTSNFIYLLISFKRFMNEITSLVACNNAMYLASAVESAISDCSFEHQYTGQPQ